VTVAFTVDVNVNCCRNAVRFRAVELGLGFGRRQEITLPTQIDSFRGEVNITPRQAQNFAEPYDAALTAACTLATRTDIFRVFACPNLRHQNHPTYHKQNNVRAKILF